MSEERLEKSIKAIKNNYPDQRYTMLREALEYVIEQAELAQEWERVIGTGHRREAYINIYEQNKRYREALEFYRERENYNPNIFCPTGKVYMSKVDYDEGYNAKKALEDV